MIHSTVGRDVQVIEYVESGRKKPGELEIGFGPRSKLKPEIYGPMVNPITFGWSKQIIII